MSSRRLGGLRSASTLAAGFTLIEVMIVVAIIAVLSAIAFPSYTEYVMRGNRAEARTALLEAQQFMERFYAANSRYTTAADANPTLPARLQNIPDASARYTLTVTATINAYTLTANPAGSMAADKCGALSVTNTGVKGRGATGPTVQECWR